MRPKTIFLTIVCAVAMAGLFGASQQPSSGQTFRDYQLRVFCNDSGVATATFWREVDKKSMGLKVICAGNCPGEGWVSLADALAGLPAGVSADFEARVCKTLGARGVACNNLCPGPPKPPDDKKPSDEPTPTPSPSRGTSEGGPGALPPGPVPPPRAPSLPHGRMAYLIKFTVEQPGSLGGTKKLAVNSVGEALVERVSSRAGTPLACAPALERNEIDRVAAAVQSAKPGRWKSSYAPSGRRRLGSVRWTLELWQRDAAGAALRNVTSWVVGKEGALPSDLASLRALAAGQLERTLAGCER
ncbi:MAG TPA: hypothetical protein VMM84_01585 [Pyrinomonadaceae bacterium]|nr:hypothetical protein [Pyrinomonadaceae bacterium]